jgi:hypothetical protein
VHAFDNLSVVETLEAQTQVVQTAQRLVGATSVIVSPITLKPRFNPYASGPVAPIPPGELPPQVDARQSSLFTAAWTVGSVQAMALGGARSVTYYETIGWRGVMEHEEGSPLPEKFYSIPGGVYPVYHIFSALADFNGADVLSTTSNNPLKVQGLALRKEDRMRLLIANLSPETQTFILKGLPLTATFILLDETTASEAMQFPEAFRSRHAMKILTGLHGLRPYAVAMLDFNL